MRRRTRSWLLLCAVLTGMLGLGLGLTLARDIPVAALLPEYATGASRFIDVDGMKVHYRDEGSGPPLLLLHGTGASLHTFNAWAAALSPHFRVVRMDLPGFGLTGPSPGADYSIPAFVAFVESFRKAVGLERFALGGNSLGGQIAWSYAVQYPERVTELILVDSAGYPIHRPVLLFRLARTPVLSSLLALMDPGFLVKKTLHEAYGDAGKVTPELSERYRRLALREGNRAAFVARAQVASVDTSADISKVRARTLLLWGEKDRLIPVEHATRFAKAIPGAQLIVYEAVGHVPMEEIGERSAADVDSFLTRVGVEGDVRVLGVPRP
jgi:pimeloyl-ACP methyl ester carboxylesterase